MQPSTIRTTTINTMHDPNILGSWHLQSTTITRSVPVEACYNPRAPHALLPHWAGLGRVAPSQPPPSVFHWLETRKTLGEPCRLPLSERRTAPLSDKSLLLWDATNNPEFTVKSVGIRRKEKKEKKKKSNSCGGSSSAAGAHAEDLLLFMTWC